MTTTAPRVVRPRLLSAQSKATAAGTAQNSPLKAVCLSREVNSWIRTELAWMTDPAPSITTMSIVLFQTRRRSMSRIPPIANAYVKPMS